MSSAPRSSRHPWIRASLMALWPLLLPFPWMLEVESCGHAVPLEKEITGTMVVGKFGLEGWLVALVVLLLVVLPPFIVAQVQRLEVRVLLHVVGLIAAGVAGWLSSFAMFFTLFAWRRPMGVGWLVLALFGGSLLEALVRAVWSVQEWQRARAVMKASTTAPG